MQTGALSSRTRVNFGIGAIAFGVKDTGFSYFLLIYYQQVLGLDAAYASLALSLAIVVDAFTDVLIGYGSDNLRSRWGRRHPLMYAAILPTVTALYFLWNPPDWIGADELFFYLVAMAILVRTCVTFFEVPNAALSAELTHDYDERTKLMAYRFAFGLWGGLGVMFLAYTFLLQPDAQTEVGTLSQSGYEKYGVMAAAVMLVAMLWSAIGTHDRIPYLPRAQGQSSKGAWSVFRQIRQSLANRSFLAVFVSRIFGGAAAGIATNLSIYFATYFWMLTSAEIGLFPLMALISVTLASLMAPAISRRYNKKSVALSAVFFLIFWTPLPLCLRLLDLFPANGHDLLLPLLLLHGLVDGIAAVISGILLGAMIADIVEDAENETGRRNEGLFFAANGFAGKMVSGVGILVAGLILSAVEFPTQVAPGEVELDKTEKLATTYIPIIGVLYLLGWVALCFYRIDRTRHETTLQNLRDKKERPAG